MYIVLFKEARGLITCAMMFAAKANLQFHFSRFLCVCFYFYSGLICFTSARQDLTTLPMQSTYRLLNTAMQFSVYQKLHFHFQGQIGDVEKTKKKNCIEGYNACMESFCSRMQIIFGKRLSDGEHGAWASSHGAGRTAYRLMDILFILLNARLFGGGKRKFYIGEFKGSFGQVVCFVKICKSSVGGCVAVGV